MNIFIWGTGKIAKKYLSLGEIEQKNILGFIQSSTSLKCCEGKKVYLPHEVSSLEYDYIFVLVSKYANDIKKTAENSGIPIEKLVFYDTISWGDGNSYPKGAAKCDRCNVNEEVIQDKFPKLYELIEARRVYAYLSISTLSNGLDLIDDEKVIYSENFDELSDYNDYFRFRTFEFVAREIKKKNVQGACAEVGVFRGAFAKYINRLFPDKNLFLFDTFEGFNVEEIEQDVAKGYATKSAIDAFKNTSIAEVKKVMTYPDMCIFRKGYFPETTKGLENESFAFVSIDVDLEDSIYECLKYFYPRLSVGGVMFIHDYNNRFYFGVKIAVQRYEKEIGHCLGGLPIADQGGTLIVTKISN